jgi:GNAT acetyltransferase-like protein
MAQVVERADEVTLFIERHTQEPFYYQRPWLDLLSRLYGYPVYTLTSRAPDGSLAGFLPALAIRSPLTGRRVVSLPFSDCCPPLVTSEAAAWDLLEQALSLAREERARYLELRTGPIDALDGQPGLARNDLYARWVVPLEADTQAVWKRVKSPAQRQVKKAAKLGVTVRVGERTSDMDAYHRLHLLTRSRKHGMPAQPLRYFRELWETFGAAGGVRLLLAEHEGAVIAGMVLLVSGSTVRYAYGASDERALRLGPNDALMWEAISWASGAGYTRFDMGRTARDNPGLAQFKRNWGAVEEPLPYYYAPEVAGLASTSEENWKYRALTACWRRGICGISYREGCGHARVDQNGGRGGAWPPALCGCAAPRRKPLHSKLGALGAGGRRGGGCAGARALRHPCAWRHTRVYDYPWRRGRRAHGTGHGGVSLRSAGIARQASVVLPKFEQ